MNRPATIVPALLAALAAAGCGGKAPPPNAPDAGPGGKAPAALAVRSDAFAHGQAIPRQYTADGKDISPPLRFSGIPAAAKQLALVCDDPDAPRARPWVHWVIYNIPPDANALPEALPATETLAAPAGAAQGRNDFGRIGYGGPAPPPGHGVHHYHFRLYALDAALDLKPGLTKRQLLDAIAAHVLAEGELVATYQR